MRSALTVSVVCLGLVSCGGGGGQSPLDGGGAGQGGDASNTGDGSTTSDGSTAPLDPALEDWLVNGPSNPVNLTVEMDTARGIDTSVGAAGGIFVVTAADGTTFELTVPANAVYNDTPLKMAPVRVTGGLPTELSEVHAVHLSPEGLTFSEMASLRVVAPVSAPLVETVPFGFHGEGQGLFLTYLGETTDPTVLLDHFSGYGIARGAILNAPAFVQRMGARAEDRLRSQVAWERMRVRREGPADPSVFPMPSALNPFFKVYEERVLAPVLNGAPACAASRDTMNLMMGMVHDRYQGGLNEHVRPDFYLAELLDSFFVDSARICLKEEHALCVSSQRVFHRLLPMWLLLRKEALAWGLEETPILDQLDTYAESLINSCLRFNLEFTSDAALGDTKEGYRVAVNSFVQIHPAPQNFTSGSQLLQGNGDLVTTLFTFVSEGCSTSAQKGPNGTFMVDDLIFETSPYVMFKETGTVRDIILRYFPGVTAQTYTVTCDTGSFTSPAEPLWTSSFVDTHESEIDQSTSLFETTTWQVAPSNPVGEKTWSVTGSESSTEAGSFELTHQPTAL